LPSETIGTVAGRHNPAAHTTTLRYRPDAVLPFDPITAPMLPLLLDTTFFVHRGTGKVPRGIRALVASRQHMVHNCGVACAELAISIGLLDPADPRTATTTAAIQAHLDYMTVDKTVAPSPSAWTEAAVLAGILARTQGLATPKRALNPDQLCCQQGRRRELLLDALFYLTAVECNLLLISANIQHMDLLLQLHPTDNVLLYRPAAESRQPTPRS
jgi:hypothetical protein